MGCRFRIGCKGHLPLLTVLVFALTAAGGLQSRSEAATLLQSIPDQEQILGSAERPMWIVQRTDFGRFDPWLHPSILSMYFRNFLTTTYLGARWESAEERVRYEDGCRLEDPPEQCEKGQWVHQFVATDVGISWKRRHSGALALHAGIDQQSISVARTGGGISLRPELPGGFGVVPTAELESIVENNTNTQALVEGLAGPFDEPDLDGATWEQRIAELQAIDELPAQPPQLYLDPNALLAGDMVALGLGLAGGSVTTALSVGYKSARIGQNLVNKYDNSRKETRFGMQRLTEAGFVAAHAVAFEVTAPAGVGGEVVIRSGFKHNPTANLDQNSPPEGVERIRIDALPEPPFPNAQGLLGAEIRRFGAPAPSVSGNDAVRILSPASINPPRPPASPAVMGERYDVGQPVTFAVTLRDDITGHAWWGSCPDCVTDWGYLPDSDDFVEVIFDEPGLAHFIRIERAVDGRTWEHRVEFAIDGDHPPAIDGTVPQDLDGDGLYMDLNANGRIDSDDVVIYFEHMDSRMFGYYPHFFDYNGNGRGDFNDLVLIQERI